MHPVPESGLAKAGRILLLVSGIVGAVGAAFLALAAIGLTAIGGTGDGPFGFIAIFYGVLAALVAVSCVFSFLAYGRVKRGDVRGAWVFGIVAACLPPVQLLPLVGAILLVVSPESEAAKRAGATS